jgi:hypothetical protein
MRGIREGLACARERSIGMMLNVLLWHATPSSLYSAGLMLVLFFLPTAAAVCPHCSGNFASCTYDTNKRCPCVTTVEANAAIVAGTAGVLTLAAIVKPKFQRVFSKVALSSLLTLLRRPAPGTPFTIAGDTTGSAIMSAISYGQISVEAALFQLSDLVEEASSEEEVSKLKSRIECLKVMMPKSGDLNSPSIIDMGIYSYIWARVSEYVSKRVMLDKVSFESRDGSSSSNTGSSSSFVARLHRPRTMPEFAEMINLFIMLCHGLGVTSVMVLTEFFAAAVYDLIRLRGETWQVAHEVMLVMFKRIEDSAGSLTLSTVYDELYLNSVIEEAKHNAAAFFRTRGGDPQLVGSNKYNGKFTSTGKPCPHFNREDPQRAGVSAPHPPDSLLPDGTCKFNHVCNKWVSDKGKNGRCLCSAGSPGHPRFKCDNPNKCNEPAQ